MSTQITMIKIALGTLYFITVLMYFTLLPSIDRIRAIELEICTQHEGYRYCENGESIEFNGGVK